MDRMNVRSSPQVGFDISNIQLLGYVVGKIHMNSQVSSYIPKN